MNKINTLDCSDIDQYLGKPLQKGRMVEPVCNTDIRRWVQAMHYPNRLHYDAEYAKESRFTRLVAPQSFTVTMDDAQGTAPACIGCIPQSHLLFGGDEWWFYGPRVFDGDRIEVERIPLDYAVKETKFAGPTCFQRGDNFYTNDRGELVAKQRSTSIRYSVARAKEIGVSMGSPDDPVWTDEQLAKLEDEKVEYINMMHALGHGKRYWDDVKVGDKLPTRAFGPHSIVSLTTEWRAYMFTIWGGTHRRTDIDNAGFGFTEGMDGKEQDPVMERENPELTDGAYIGPTRGHLSPRWARHIGMPRAYGYGASMGAWTIDYLAGWAGEWGLVLHSNCLYRGPAYTGDATYMTASVVDKKIEQGQPIVQIDCKMVTQLGTTMATAKAEVQLPKK